MKQRLREVMELAQCHFGLESDFETRPTFGFICPRINPVAGPGFWNPHLHSLALDHLLEELTVATLIGHLAKSKTWRAA